MHAVQFQSDSRLEKLPETGWNNTEKITKMNLFSIILVF